MIITRWRKMQKYCYYALSAFCIGNENLWLTR